MFGLIGFWLATVVLFIGVVRIVYPPLWRDLYTLFVNIRVIRRVKKAYLAQELVIDQFERQALLRSKHPLIIFKDQRFTYSEVNRQANRVAHSLVKLGIRQGNVIAIVMTNEPAFLWIYLGVQKLGARVALVNHHLLSEGLRYSITSCAPKLVITGSGQGDSITERVTHLQPKLDIPLYTYHPEHNVDLPIFSEIMAEVSDDPFPASFRSGVRLSDPCAFIFTSGTTGLPKPAIISHKKAILCSYCFSPVGFSSKEIMYLTLPLYHSSALNLAFLNVINVGATIVLREKFSVSDFWPDCVKYKVTCFQYIGEMLRYLVNSAEKPDERHHKIWAAIGNGLRPDIWIKFKSRFILTKYLSSTVLQNFQQASPTYSMFLEVLDVYLHY
uniref:Long-chain-fatty-acid--CoA ligase n=1 Tax=Arion vulgaris TaxID=1028688 RepID=A0A0B7BKD3_9EUPU